MCVCVYVCAYMRVRVWSWISSSHIMHVYMHSKRICMYTSVCTLHVCIHPYAMYTSVCNVYIRMHACMYVHIRMYYVVFLAHNARIYIRIHTCSHKYIHNTYKRITANHMRIYTHAFMHSHIQIHICICTYTGPWKRARHKDAYAVICTSVSNAYARK
jgi:hypothetical protein